MTATPTTPTRQPAPATIDDGFYRIEACGTDVRLWLRDPNCFVIGNVVVRPDQAALLATDLARFCKQMS